MHVCDPVRTLVAISRDLSKSVENPRGAESRESSRDRAETERKDDAQQGTVAGVGAARMTWDMAANEFFFPLMRGLMREATDESHDHPRAP